MITHQCPHCHNALRIPDQYAGQKGSCKKCGREFVVPENVNPLPARNIDQFSALKTIAVWYNILAYFILIVGMPCSCVVNVSIANMYLVGEAVSIIMFVAAPVVILVCFFLLRTLAEAIHFVLKREKEGQP